METHAHELHKAPGHGWKHYFFEFFMLFLAVTLGFFVENIRELLAEKQRAKVYASNLFNELKNDTSSLNFLIAHNELTAAKLDTFCLLIKEKNKQPVTSGMLYYYGSSATNAVYFSMHNATFEELKSSGNLRIMGNEMANKLSEYDNSIVELDREYGLDKTEFEKIEDLHFKIFDVYILEKMLPESSDKKSPQDSVFAINDLPISADPELMKQYTGRLKFAANIYRFEMKEYLSPIKNRAEKLLELLTREYHIN